MSNINQKLFNRKLPIVFPIEQTNRVCGPSAIGSTLTPLSLEFYELGCQILAGTRVKANNIVIG